MAGLTVSFEDVQAIRQTDRAVLCLIEGSEVWISQSQIHEDSEVWKAGDCGELVITEWLATEKGLI